MAAIIYIQRRVGYDTYYRIRCIMTL